MHNCPKRILFLLKKRSTYGVYSDTLESGLLNSARMTMESLIQTFGVEATLKICVDGNSVDREIHLYKPSIVILEALWVTPKKLEELVRKYPNILFVIRVHSEIPFLSNEGIAVKWCKEYSEIDNVLIGFNSKTTVNDFHNVINWILHLPNLYQKVADKKEKSQSLVDFLFNRGRKWHKNVINIGCFGAIRPMKNQLLQAVAAIKFADKYDIRLRFHVNVKRIEHGGDPVLRNMRALFEGTRHTLVEHSWLDRDEFLKLIAKMDLGLQVSMNESFNIITADFVSQDVPIIVSETIDWMPSFSKVGIENTKDIVNKIENVLRHKDFYTRINRRALIKYNHQSLDEWYKFLTSF